jgi:hypothetical protein
MSGIYGVFNKLSSDISFDDPQIPSIRLVVKTAKAVKAPHSLMRRKSLSFPLHKASMIVLGPEEV